MVDFVLNAKARNDIGKGASRRLRRLDNQIPAMTTRYPPSFMVWVKHLRAFLSPRIN